jgi:Flp pilus assembly protein TadB
MNLRYRFAFVLAAAGVGLCGYAALLWHELPRYSEQDLQASAELNLALDLARSETRQPLTMEQLDERRKQVRAEIDQSLAAERARVERWLAAGLALLVVALGQFVAGRLNYKETGEG